ncbi:SCO2400 family protein [Streptomyces sp. HD]|uniref:SCO2400 family protein n=1 Tax=Streptomyces sp. HD TaxID=3020892 RepID=UPI003FA7C5B6
MDYCSSCRRHLNGALVCPGCGAYAPDIAPSAAAGAAMPVSSGAAATGTAAWETPAGTPADTSWYDGYFRDETASPARPEETAPGAPSGDVEGDVEGVAVAPEGRAARRRQRARWKKNQRRAVVATAVALVGGGLTVSAMNRGTADKAQAATAPERPNVGLPQQESELTRPASTPSDTHKESRADTPSSHPTPTNAAREPVTTPRTTRHFTRPDAAGTPSPAATTVPQTQTVSPAPGGANSGDSTGGEAAEQPPPATTPTDDSDSAATPAPTSPAPEETTPAQLCVLNLVCLG